MFARWYLNNALTLIPPDVDIAIGESVEAMWLIV